MIARVLAEKDTLRSQLMELQERLFSAHTRGGAEEQRHSFGVTEAVRPSSDRGGATRSRAALLLPPRTQTWTGSV